MDFLVQQNIGVVAVATCLTRSINVLPCPAVSPDRAPIEHVWDVMQRHLRALPSQPVSLSALDETLVKIWNGIPKVFFNSLVSSMRRRCQVCIDANGGHMCY